MNFMPYTVFSDEQLSKVGNTIIYLSERVGPLSKTKLLKLLYILDEISIKKFGYPMLNLDYKVWKFGPVSEEIFVDLSTHMIFFRDYIKEENDLFHPIASFNDDEFSKNDIGILDFVIETFGNKSAKELISHTHRPNSPWYDAAKDGGVLELLEKEIINNTEIKIDMSSLIRHDERKMDIYENYREMH